MVFDVKRTTPRLIMLAVTLVSLLNYYLGTGKVIVGAMTSWASLLVNFAVILATATFIIRSVKDIRTRPHEIYLIVWSLIVFLVVTAVGIAETTAGDLYTTIYNNFILPPNTMMLGMAGFWFLFTFWRRLKARNMEGLFVLVIFIITLVGSSPLLLTYWKGPGMLVDWIKLYPGKGTDRALYTVASIGAISTIIRSLLGVEWGFLPKKARMEEG